MKNIIAIFVIIIIAINCNKPGIKDGIDVIDDINKSSCNIEKAYTENAAKVTIKNGVWGTVSFMEGNCMPGFDATSRTCTNCPVKRVIKIYEYTTENDAAKSEQPGFYNSFSTRLIKQVETDDNGFFETELTAGDYTLVVGENGKLYTSEGDIYGGINPFTFSTGTKKINFALSYKASF